MEPSEIVSELWTRVQARDWQGLGELLAGDLVVEWPVSGERIVGRDNYVGAHAAHPEGRSVRVLRILTDGDAVVSEVEIPHDSTGVHRVVSLWTVRDDRIVAAREYWTEAGSGPAPEWRAPYVQRM